MPICDRFEIAAVVDEARSSIDFHVVTDLPAGTQIILSCQRTYRDGEGNECLWVGGGDRLATVPAFDGVSSECRGGIDVNACDRQAYRLFLRIERADAAGISTPVGDDFTLEFIVGGRQRLKEFGRGNADLSGARVADAGGINVVRDRRSFCLPLPASLQPSMGRGANGPYEDENL